MASNLRATVSLRGGNDVDSPISIGNDMVPCPISAGVSPTTTLLGHRIRGVVPTASDSQQARIRVGTARFASWLREPSGDIALFVPDSCELV